MLDFVLQPEILALLAILVVAILGWQGRKYLNHFRLVFQVWHLVEKLGILRDLKGYEKLALAMDIFQEKFYEKFGHEPDASDQGWAVKILTLLCQVENKDKVDDFLPEPKK